MVRSYRYHATLDPVIIETEEQEAALGPGWFDSPNKALAYAAERAIESKDFAELPPTLDGLKAEDALKLIAVANSEVAKAWLDAELSKAKPRAGVTRVLGERLEALAAMGPAED